MYVPGSGRIIAQATIVEDNGTITDRRLRYLHDDNLGSVNLVTDESGSAAKLDYEPFGAPLATAGAEITKGFTFHEHDAELGLVNMKGRIYDPKLSRFLAPDPIVGDALSVGSWNPYSYVENNPVSRTDPSGFAEASGGQCVVNVLGLCLWRSSASALSGSAAPAAAAPPPAAAAAPTQAGAAPAQTAAASGSGAGAATAAQSQEQSTADTKAYAEQWWKNQPYASAMAGVPEPGYQDRGATVHTSDDYGTTIRPQQQPAPGVGAMGAVGGGPSGGAGSLGPYSPKPAGPYNCANYGSRACSTTNQPMRAITDAARIIRSLSAGHGSEYATIVYGVWSRGGGYQYSYTTPTTDNEPNSVIPGRGEGGLPPGAIPIAIIHGHPLTTWVDASGMVHSTLPERWNPEDSWATKFYSSRYGMPLLGNYVVTEGGSIMWHMIGVGHATIGTLP